MYIFFLVISILGVNGFSFIPPNSNSIERFSKYSYNDISSYLSEYELDYEVNCFMENVDKHANFILGWHPEPELPFYFLSTSIENIYEKSHLVIHNIIENPHIYFEDEKNEYEMLLDLKELGLVSTKRVPIMTYDVSEKWLQYYKKIN